MGTVVTVNQDSFETAVLQQSHTLPVLVDFFAHWCGPCQMLKPMLERLAQEYEFVLAKVDIDANPGLAQTYGVEGVPDVKVVMNGEVMDAFVGVLPEPQLRQLMAQLNLKSVVDQQLQAIYNQVQLGQVADAQNQLEALLQSYPNNHTLTLAAVDFFVDQQDFATATQLLGRIPDTDRDYAEAVNQRRALIRFQSAVSQPVETDLDKTYQQAAQAALSQDFETALMLFLEIVSRDRAYRNEAGRQGMVAIFDLLGDDHPLTRHYRKMLTRTLF